MLNVSWTAFYAQVEKNEARDDDEIALLTSDNSKRFCWIIDSGATHHMTFEVNNPSDYVEFKKPCKVNLRDDRVIFAYGKSTYRLCTNLKGTSQRIALKNVLYLPDLKRNLLSAQAIIKLRATVVVKDDECKFPKI